MKKTSAVCVAVGLAGAWIRINGAHASNRLLPMPGKWVAGAEKMAVGHEFTAPKGQEKVFEAWRLRLRGRSFIAYQDIDIPAINRELAYVSVLGCEDGRFRFRLAGTGLQHVFGGEARGKSVDEIEACRGQVMWAELASRALLRATPVSGMSRRPDGTVHYWLRLPLSSDGAQVDLVMCHDRYLPAEALLDPDGAASRADMSLRLDNVDRVAA